MFDRRFMDRDPLDAPSTPPSEMNPHPPALLVADGPGLITDRQARAFIRLARTHDRVVHSSVMHPYAVRRMGKSFGVIHWLDPLAFAFYPRSTNVPQVVMIHHLTEPEIPGFLNALPHCDAISTVSRRWQRRIHDCIGREALLIPHSIDVETFRPIEDPSLRRDAGIPDDAFVIGYSGRAASDAFKRKNIDLLSEVLIQSSARWPEVIVLLIGNGWETLDATLRARGVRVIRRRPTRTEDTASMYPMMSVLVSTSSEEGGPCTILEAMACGVPVITTDVGHVPELIHDGENGFICESTATRFLERIELLRRDPALVRRIANSGRRTIVEERDERIVIPRIDFDSLYATAIRRYAARSSGEHIRRTLGSSLLAVRYGARRLLKRSDPARESSK